MSRPRLVTRLLEPYNAGTRLDLLGRSPITASDCFYVRNHGAVPRIDSGRYRLTVEGLVGRPASLRLADLLTRFERRELVATLHCAGNRRAELSRVRPIPSPLQWGPDAVGTAVWSGIRLADLLAWVGPGAEAGHVCFEGYDQAMTADGPTNFGGSIPIDKALAGEVLLADRMNGRPLTRRHGAPLRVVVPGYIGARSVKWLAGIRLSTEPSDNWFQASDYRRDGQALGGLELNSAITEPADGARLAAGVLSVRGYAVAGHGRRIGRIELSSDAGESWSLAELGGGESPWAWRLWKAEVQLEQGDHELVVRAWDDVGSTQPADPAGLWNPGGYMNTAWHRLRVTARA